MIKIAGHFGELLQGRLGAGGPIVLVSLPCAALSLTATRKSGTGLWVHCAGQALIAPAVAERFLRALPQRLTGRISMRAEMPVGGGAGSSTAALTALAHLAGITDPDLIARAAVQAEGASDPLMFPNAERLLWASRSAEIVSNLPELPAFEVLGGFLGAPQRTRAEDDNFPDISDLLQGWPSTMSAFAARVTESARRSLACRGLPEGPLPDLARRFGAQGWVIAHTGSARGLIFPRGEVPAQARAALQEAGFRKIVQFKGGK